MVFYSVPVLLAMCQVKQAGTRGSETVLALTEPVNYNDFTETDMVSEIRIQRRVWILFENNNSLFRDFI